MELAVQAHDEDKRVYTVKEIAQILGISKNTAYAFVNEEKGFNTVRIKNKILISRKSFDEWLDRNAV